MNYFESLDKTSFSFRYPIDNGGAQNFVWSQTVDLRATKLIFDDGMILLKHTMDVLGPYVDHKRWLEDQMDSNWY